MNGSLQYPNQNNQHIVWTNIPDSIWLLNKDFLDAIQNPLASVHYIYRILPKNLLTISGILHLILLPHLQCLKILKYYSKNTLQDPASSAQLNSMQPDELYSQDEFFQAFYKLQICHLSLFADTLYFERHKFLWYLLHKFLSLFHISVNIL